LLTLWGETNKTVFFVTHDIEEALILADRVLLVRDGRIVQDLSNTLPRPRDEDVRASRPSVEMTKTIVDQLGSGGSVGVLDPSAGGD
jgi:NitT/TauT family transport system ATP-binding protein